MEIDNNEDRHLIVDALIEELSDVSDRDSMRILMQRHHVADIADAMADLPDAVQERLLTLMEPEEQGDILEEVDDEDAADFVEDMAPQQLAEIIGSMPHDEAADLLDTMSKSRAESILSLITREEALQLRELLSYEPDTAGGIMTNEFISARPQDTIQNVREKIKSSDIEEEALGTIIICREDMKLIGLVTAEDMLAAPADTMMSTIMERAAVTVGPTADQEVCARYMTKYELQMLPVVDPRRRIVGIITFDDILEVLDEEASEDMYRMAGVGAVRPLDQGSVTRAFKRLPWFIITILGMSLLGWIISSFETTIDKVVAVSFFIPAIMGLAGNVGIQASTITVRGLAMDEIQFRDLFWLLRRELVVGVIIGLVCGLSMMLVSSFMTKDEAYITEKFMIGKGEITLRKNSTDTEQLIAINEGAISLKIENTEKRPLILGFVPRFPFTVGFAMFAGIIGSVLLGTCVPMLCHRIGVDPALASGPFVTTLIDIGTQSLYLGLATWLLLG